MHHALDVAVDRSDAAFCRNQLGDLALSTGDLTAARAEYDAGQAADPTSVTLLRGQSRLAAMTGDLSAAIGHAHGHGHGHDHVHAHPVQTRWGLAGIGIAGGLVPSPSALVVLLVMLCGAGMAATLAGAGLLLVTVQRRHVGARRRRRARVARRRRVTAYVARR